MSPSRSRALRRATVLAIVVGSLIVLVNHGDHLLQEPICDHFCLKATLSFLTPFLVSLLSSTLAARDAASRP